MIKRSSFASGYGRAQRDLEVCLSSYLKNQGEEEVHRLRTSIRRFDRCSALLPASLRKQKEMRKYRSKLRKLMKLNGRIRELDTIRRGLAVVLADPELVWLLSMIKMERSGLEGPARQLASSIAPQSPPMDWEKVSQRKLQRRFAKVAGRILEELDDALGVALKDPRQTEALHAARIATKELRYTLELLPRDQTRKVLQALAECQNTLGVLRDIDVTTEYLRGYDLPRDLADFVTAKREERRQLYLRFLDAHKRYRLAKRVRSAIMA